MQQQLAGLLLAAASVLAVPFNPFAIPPGGRLMDVAFTPGLRTMYVTKVVGSTYTIVATNESGNGWSDPKPVAFSGHWRDLEEVLSPDGRTMVFASNRPIDGGTKPIDGNYGHILRPARGGNLWQTTWTGAAWSAPVRLPAAINGNTSTFSPALAGDGTLYFMRASGPKATFHIFVAELEHGTYQSSPLRRLATWNIPTSIPPSLRTDRL